MRERIRRCPSPRIFPSPPSGCYGSWWPWTCCSCSSDSLAYTFSHAIARDFRELLDITGESNLPTWFSSTQLFFTGAVAYFLARERRAQALTLKAIGWSVLALFFIYIGIDDASRFHERVGTVMGEAANRDASGLLRELGNFPSYYWQISFLPLFGGLGVFMLIFLWRELQTRKVLRMFLLGCAYYAAAVGLDYFDGLVWYYAALAKHAVFSVTDLRHLFRALEEFIEILGTTLILVSFWTHWEYLQARRGGDEG